MRRSGPCKRAKTFFVVSRSLDNVPLDSTGFDRPLGHALELVPVSHPVTPMGPGQKLHLQLIFNGKPLANTRISFIPAVRHWPKTLINATKN